MTISFSAIEVCEEPLSELRRHVAVPNSFLVETALDVLESATGFELRERKLAQPYRKDYDSIESPLDWLDRFDTSRWALMGRLTGMRGSEESSVHSLARNSRCWRVETTWLFSGTSELRRTRGGGAELPCFVRSRSGLE